MTVKCDRRHDRHMACYLMSRRDVLDATEVTTMATHTIQFVEWSLKGRQATTVRAMGEHV